MPQALNGLWRSGADVSHYGQVNGADILVLAQMCNRLKHVSLRKCAQVPSALTPNTVELISTVGALSPRLGTREKVISGGFEGYLTYKNTHPTRTLP